MCSDRFLNLLNDYENAVSQCASDAVRQQGAVSIRVLSKAVITRAAVVHEVADLERRSDLWRRARAANGIEEGD